PASTQPRHTDPYDRRPHRSWPLRADAHAQRLLNTGATARAGPGSGRGARRDALFAAAHRWVGVALLWRAVPSGTAGGEWLKRGLLGSKKRCPPSLTTNHGSDERGQHGGQ